VNDEQLALLLEDPERLDAAAWAEALAEVRADPRRLREQARVDEQLARLLDPGRADLAAAVAQRLQGASRARFVRRVVRSSRPRGWWAPALAANLVLAAILLWLALPRTETVAAGGEIAFAGGRVAVGLDGAWRSGSPPRLLTGRAVLDVHEPCTVAVPGGQVRVLGTRFSLQADDAGTLVAVERGRVAVEGAAATILGAGQQARLSAAGVVGPILDRLLTFLPTDVVARRGDFATWESALTAGPDGFELASFIATGYGWTGVRVVPQRANAGRPDLTVILRYRLLHPRPDVRLQVMNREQDLNYHLARYLPGSAGVWHAVAVPLVELEAIAPEPRAWQTGEHVEEILLYVAGEHGDVLRLADVSLALPAGGR